MAIDRAVLLPGQELMERMDREYDRTGDWKPHGEVVKDVERETAGKEAEGREDGPGSEGTSEIILLVWHYPLVVLILSKSGKTLSFRICLAGLFHATDLVYVD